jgi:hypothetical protein
MNSTIVSRFFLSVGSDFQVTSTAMAIDPTRLARIRSRLLAAAVLAVPACGGAPQTINHAQPEPTPKQHDGSINEVVADPPPASPEPGPSKPEDIHVNTPPPDAAMGESADGRDINQPNPDTTTRVIPPKNVPPTGQTINKAPTAAPIDQHVNTPAPAPKPKKPKENVNTPEPMRRPDHINTPKPD